MEKASKRQEEPVDLLTVQPHGDTWSCRIQNVHLKDLNNLFAYLYAVGSGIAKKQCLVASSE